MAFVPMIRCQSLLPVRYPALRSKLESYLLKPQIKVKLSFLYESCNIGTSQGYLAT